MGDKAAFFLEKKELLMKCSNTLQKASKCMIFIHEEMISKKQPTFQRISLGPLFVFIFPTYNEFKGFYLTEGTVFGKVRLKKKC